MNNSKYLLMPSIRKLTRYLLDGAGGDALPQKAHPSQLNLSNWTPIIQPPVGSGETSHLTVGQHRVEAETFPLVFGASPHHHILIVGE